MSLPGRFLSSALCPYITPLLESSAQPIPLANAQSSPSIFFWVPETFPELKTEAGSIGWGVPIIEAQGP